MYLYFVACEITYFAVKSSDIGKCTEICYKDPVLEDRQWSAYIDRSPGQDSYSLVSNILLPYWFDLVTTSCRSYANKPFTTYSSYCCPSATFLILYLFSLSSNVHFTESCSDNCMVRKKIYMMPFWTTLRCSLAYHSLLISDCWLSFNMTKQTLLC